MKKLTIYERFVAMSGMLNSAGQARFMKFIAVGVMNTAIAYFIFAAFLYSGVHYTLAVLFAYFLVVIINFKTYGRLVYKSRDNRLIFRFVSVYAFLYVLNIVCLKVFSLFSINLYVASLFMIVPFAIISFFLNSRYVFRPIVYK